MGATVRGMAKLKIGDIEHEIPDAVAAHFQAEATAKAKLEQEANSAAEALGKAKAEADAKLATEADAKRRAEQDGLIKKGEFDKALEIERGRVKSVADQFTSAQADALLWQHLREGLTDAEKRDAGASVRQAFEFDLNTGKLVVKADAGGGEPSAYVAKWLADRPSLARPKNAAGSGADPARESAGGNAGQQRRTKMSDQEQCDFINKNGQSAFMALPA